MKNIIKRKIVPALLSLTLLMSCVPLAAAGDTEADGLKIAILGGITAEGSAPYDAEALAGLFASGGNFAKVITADEAACYDDFGADKYDLLMIPTGAAFPAIAADGLKRFLRDGGKLITSGGYAFSETVWESDAEGAYGGAAVVTSPSVSSSPCIYRAIPASEFASGKTYTVSLDMKTEGISTEGGMAHASVYIYDSASKLLSWKDFAAYTSGSSDWAKKSWSFTVPGKAARVDIRLGLYITAGTASYDNVKIEAPDGATVFFDDFESGTLDGWTRTVSGGGIAYDVGEGVYSSGSRELSVYSSSVGDGGWKYDLTSALAGANTATVEFTQRLTSVSGDAGAYLALYSGGEEISRTPICRETGSSGRHIRRAEAPVGTGWDKAELVFGLSGSGKAEFYNISVTSDGKEALYDSGTGAGAAAFGNVSATVEARENETVGIASNEPTQVGDLLFYSSSHIPLFDEETVFSDAVSLISADSQEVFSSGVCLTDENGTDGYSAITWNGNNRGRWQPLLYACDGAGQKIGVAAAIFRVFSSPSDYGVNTAIESWNDYAGASVGFFGVTDRDLFAEGNDALRAGLLKLADTLCRGGYICSVKNAYDCYRAGETPQFIVYIENNGGETAEYTLEITVTSEDTGKTVFSTSESVSVFGTARKTARVRWEGAELADDYYGVTAVLSKDGAAIDSYSSGFVVWDDATVAAGPSYTYHDNYIYVKQPDGSEKAVYASGVDDGGNAFLMEEQTPAVWKNDFERRRDTGLYIYENLQLYRGYSDYAAAFANGYPTENALRSIDCAVYLSQKYGQIYMMCMLIGQNSAASDGQLAADGEYVTKLSERYKNVPGIIYYLNGDLIVKPSSQTDGLFREFLTKRYGSDTAFAEAWGVSAAIADTSYDTSYSFGGKGWTDVKAYDQNLFRATLIERWTGTLAAAVNAVTGGDRIVTCEYYAWPMDSTDVPQSIGDMTYSNIGFFDKIEIFSETYAYSDQRWQGKSGGIGETNKRTHPAFSETLDYYKSGSASYAAAFLRSTYYTAYAMGASHYQVWCWKDEAKYNFPWGLIYRGAGVRPSFYSFRNSNLLTRSAEPEYTVPETAFITADSTRFSGSGGWYAGHYAVLGGIDILQGTLVSSVLTLNECNLQIPEGVKVIFYPLAYTMPDDVFEKLTAFVKNGGVLYLSGDFAYDGLTRRRTNGDRLSSLAGVTGEALYSGMDFPSGTTEYSSGGDSRTGKPNVKLSLAGAEAIYSAADGTPVVTSYKLGSGTVFYSADPFEAFTDGDTFASDTGIYKKVLAAAGVAVSDIKASTLSLRTFTLSLAGGGQARVIANTSNADVKTEYTVGGKTYSFRIGGYQTAVFCEDASGEIVAADVLSDVSCDGAKLIVNDCAASLLPLDGRALDKASSLAVLPTADGRVTLTTSAFADPVAVRGTVCYGKFIEAGAAELTYASGRLAAEGLTAGDIVLVCERGNEDEAKSALLTLLTGGTSGGDEEISLPESSAEEESSGKSGWIAAAAAAALLLAGAIIYILKKKK